MNKKFFICWLITTLVLSVVFYVCHQEGIGYIPTTPWSSGKIEDKIYTFVFSGITSYFILKYLEKL